MTVNTESPKVWEQEWPEQFKGGMDGTKWKIFTTSLCPPALGGGPASQHPACPQAAAKHLSGKELAR